MMYLLLYILSLLFFPFSSSQLTPTQTFSDFTHSVFNYAPEGTIAAFGDFNSDKKTDLFAISPDGKKAKIWLATSTKFEESKDWFVDITSLYHADAVITGVVPGDYNGDSRMDLLFTVQPTPSENYTKVHVQWNTHEGQKLITNIEDKFLDQPLVLDSNADMILDLFGSIEVDGQETRYFWHFNDTSDEADDTINGTFDKTPFSNSAATLSPLYVPQSHAFVALDEDRVPDLLVTSKNGDGVATFETWRHTEENPYQQLKGPIPAPDNYMGQSVFADIDGSGSIAHLLPTCAESECKTSSIYARFKNDDKFKSMNVKFEDENKVAWGFIPAESNSMVTGSLPFSIHMGDYTMDGFVDGVAVLQNTQNKTERKVVLLENVESSNGARTFKLNFNSMPSFDRPVIAAFFDVYDDGILDILVVSQASINLTTTVKAVRNIFNGDAYFLKVLVLSGLCFSQCPSGLEPYGVNQHGPYVVYSTTDPNGKEKKCAGYQLAQSAYFSLQLPFVLFGLGPTPNFVEHLTVSIPSTVESPRSKTFTQIIPNSHMIIIPYPYDEPSSWTYKLLVTPSHNVLLTLGALLGTGGFVAGIAGIFWFREKKQDQKEKRQQSHQFHFDAM